MKTNNLILLVISSFLFWLPQLDAGQSIEPEPVEPGITVEQLFVLKGSPKSNMTVGDKSVLKWPDLIVTASKGIVIKAEPIDVEARRLETIERENLAKQKNLELKNRRLRIERQNRNNPSNRTSATNKPLEYAILQNMQNSALQGNTRTQLDLGNRYLRGNGVPKNEQEAYRWFAMAAKSGHSGAQYSLGNLYLKGTGVPLNPQVALSWFTKAGHSRHPQALYELGVFYEEGHYVGQDLEQSYIWFSLAGYAGNSSAWIKRDQLAHRLNADQLSNAKSRIYKMRFWRY